MTNASLTSALPLHHAAGYSASAPDRTASGCPAWCTVGSECDPGSRHVAHRAAIWELPDRVELCVMQVISDDPQDIVQANLPTLYFWSADDAELTDAECAEMACAIRRSAEVLCGLNGVSPIRGLRST